MWTNTFSPSYIVYKVEVELVYKRYGINLEHYPTSSFVPYKIPNFDLYYLFHTLSKINKFHFKRFFQDLHIFFKKPENIK
jgi:hypothetical protein